MALLEPDERISRLSAIPPKSLRQRGFRLVLLDMDDVLIPRDGGEIHNEIHHWIEKAKQVGLSLYVISNSKFPRRVKEACASLGLEGTSWAMKPFPFAFRKAMQKYKVKRDEAVVVGDQLFSDILGAKWAGIHSIFVKPMTPERRWDRKIMRWLEKRLGGR